MGLRLFNPCADPTGANCTVFEDPATLHLNQTRWYPSTARIFDGSIVSILHNATLFPSNGIAQIIVGGMHEETPFYNTDPVNSFEFFPSKDNNTPRPSAFLERSLPTNLFPRYDFLFAR